MSSLRSIPLTLAEANYFVSLWHRHHRKVTGHRLSIGAIKDSKIVGICIVGRPVARAVDQHMIAEITRVSTDGTRNCCSFLYSVATRVCREMGFRELWTYTLHSESGISLRALKQLGWLCDGIVRKDGKGWNSRPERKTDQPTCPKNRWRVIFRKESELIVNLPGRLATF